MSEQEPTMQPGAESAPAPDSREVVGGRYVVKGEATSTVVGERCLVDELVDGAVVGQAWIHGLDEEFGTDWLRRRATLSHASIAGYRGAFEDSGWLLLVTDAPASGSVAELASDETRLMEPEEVGALLAHVAEGLEYLHGRQLEHGDLRPETVHLGEGRHVLAEGRLSDLVDSGASDLRDLASLGAWLVGRALGEPLDWAGAVELARDSTRLQGRFEQAPTEWQAVLAPLSGEASCDAEAGDVAARLHGAPKPGVRPADLMVMFASDAPEAQQAREMVLTQIRAELSRDLDALRKEIADERAESQQVRQQVGDMMRGTEEVLQRLEKSAGETALRGRAAENIEHGSWTCPKGGGIHKFAEGRIVISVSSSLRQAALSVSIQTSGAPVTATKRVEGTGVMSVETPDGIVAVHVSIPEWQATVLVAEARWV